MMELQRGGNAPVNGGQVTVRVDWAGPPGLESDISAYLLGENGRVGGDHDMIFYNQPSGGGGAVSLSPGAGSSSFAIDLARLPAAVDRITFCLTIDEAQARGHRFSMLSRADLSVSGGADIRFPVPREGASEAAMILGELYRRQGAWKFRAVGQGFDGGLGPLARSFGISVDDEPAAAPPPPPAAAPQPAAAPPPIGYPPAAAPHPAGGYPPAPMPPPSGGYPPAGSYPPAPAQPCAGGYPPAPHQSAPQAYPPAGGYPPAQGYPPAAPGYPPATGYPAGAPPAGGYPGAPQPGGGVNFAKPPPVILTKPEQSQRVSLAKDSPDKLIVSAVWIDNGDRRSNNDDLDLRVGLLLPNGAFEMIHAPKRSGAYHHPPYVYHTGDVRQASARMPGRETVEVNPAIASFLGGRVGLVFSVYSAVSNGAVSVGSLQPRMRMEYRDQVVDCAIDWANHKAGRKSTVYTFVLGTAVIDYDGITLRPSGATSKPWSEKTPRIRWLHDGSLEVTVDGPHLFK
jgi:stress response protein SCP2